MAKQLNSKFTREFTARWCRLKNFVGRKLFIGQIHLLNKFLSTTFQQERPQPVHTTPPGVLLSLIYGMPFYLIDIKLWNRSLEVDVLKKKGTIFSNYKPALQNPCYYPWPVNTRATARARSKRPYQKPCAPPIPLRTPCTQSRPISSRARSTDQKKYVLKHISLTFLDVAHFLWFISLSRSKYSGVSPWGIVRSGKEPTHYAFAQQASTLLSSLQAKGPKLKNGMVSEIVRSKNDKYCNFFDLSSQRHAGSSKLCITSRIQRALCISSLILYYAGLVTEVHCS